MTKERPKMSVVVPIYDMVNKGIFMERLFASLVHQTFQDFEVVIADNCATLGYYKYPTLNVRHFVNWNRGMAVNTNFGIKNSEGEIIKVLYMDDWLAHDKALENIVNNFTGQWLITGANTNPHPYWTDNIETGNNKLGSPSALTIKNEGHILFDENLGWLLDCLYYRQMHDLYGPPVILDEIGVNLGIGPHQQTEILSPEEKEMEFYYIRNKYDTAQ